VPTCPHQPQTRARAQLDADAFPDLVDRFKVDSVPAFLFFLQGQHTDTLLGADAAALVGKVRQHALSAAIHTDQLGAAAAAATPQQSLDDRLGELTARAPVMLFMKGSPDAPRCGFSRKICEMLQARALARQQPPPAQLRNPTRARAVRAAGREGALRHV
jgi:hypothetical protein